MSEDQLRAVVKTKMRLFHPKVFFNHRTDKKSGLGVDKHFRQGVLSGMPDMEVFLGTDKYNGLHIEQKILEKDPFRILPRKKVMAIDNETDGVYSQEAEHVRRQAFRIWQLNQNGYFACFAVGDEAVIDIVDWYKKDGHPDYFGSYSFTYNEIYGDPFSIVECTIPIWNNSK